ncbi:MAG: hypothetical protein ACLPV8_16810 [Steroidobacteraceae bacterium]
MSNVTRLPPHANTVHVEADIPISQRDEFERAIVDIVAGERPRMGVTHALRGRPGMAAPGLSEAGIIRHFMPHPCGAALKGVRAGIRRSAQLNALDRDLGAIKIRAMLGLQEIEKAINDHPTTGGARRLVRFLAGMYNGQDYPFDLAELRSLDTKLANACLDYLNYDRLGVKEVHKHLANGERDLRRWLEEYRIVPASSRS